MRIVMSTSLALLVACLSVDPPEGRLACTEARGAMDCPGGWACVEGFCYRSPRGGPGPVPDAAMDAEVALDAEVACTSPSECDDGNDCSIDTCEENACRNTFTPNELADRPDENGDDANCDGADGVVTRDLYVAPGATGTGSLDNPASFEAALAAFDGDRHILMAAGAYAIGAPLVAPNEVRIHGGYGRNYRSRPGGTRVLSSASQALILREVTAATIDQVDWATAAGTSPGAHTQTVTVINSSGVLLRRLVIAAGDGAAGANGATGAAGSPPGAAGPNGDNGNGTQGGAGSSCATPGGQGGGSNGPQVAGSPAVLACGHGGVQGGTVNDYRSCETGLTYLSSSPGKPGEPGCPQLGRGATGAGGSGAGSIVGADGIWSGVAGSRGGDGPRGNPGGGGGGGGPFMRSSCSTSSGGGGGGGCGGLGGDGGDGGEPGQGGGASIAMVVQDSAVTLEGVTLRTGAGAVGGQGGAGGPGANGVVGSGGGIGGTVTGSNYTRHQGASGGAGGTGSAGGPGGCGGGGAGGGSIGVFLVGSGSIDPQSVTYELGVGGSGGAACLAAAVDVALGQAGEPGMAVEVLHPL